MACWYKSVAFCVVLCACLSAVRLAVLFAWFAGCVAIACCFVLKSWCFAWLWNANTCLNPIYLRLEKRLFFWAIFTHSPLLSLFVSHFYVVSSPVLVACGLSFFVPCFPVLSVHTCSLACLFVLWLVWAVLFFCLFGCVFACVFWCSKKRVFVLFLCTVLLFFRCFCVVCVGLFAHLFSLFRGFVVPSKKKIKKRFALCVFLVKLSVLLELFCGSLFLNINWKELRTAWAGVLCCTSSLCSAYVGVLLTLCSDASVRLVCWLRLCFAFFYSLNFCLW